MIGCDDTGTTAMPEQNTASNGIDADTAVIPGHRKITSCNDPSTTAIQEQNEISCVDADTSAAPGESAMIVCKDTCYNDSGRLPH